MDILNLGGLGRVLVAAAIAAVPALVTYVRGRRIARLADDPALPERLFEGRRTASGPIMVAIPALVVLTGTAAIWAIPLALVGYVAAGYPVRRLLFNETWSFADCLSFVIRFFLANWSFWLLVCALPALALSAGGRAWMVATALGGGLMVYAAWQTEVIRWLIGCKPIADEAIRGRFDRLVTACGLPAPWFEVIDLRGGSMANAFALPSLHRSSVIFTGPLIERLDADETDAICAHELAHLEYYNPRRMRQRRLVSRSLVAAGAVLAPLSQFLFPSAAWWLCGVWPLVVLISMGRMVRDRQKHETASDLRAVAITGNPEALIRALVKIHAMARVPRRWDADLERHHSHPSLKRRIQDIRAAAGTPPAALGDAAAFDGADGGARVVFGSESLEWIEGTSASYRLRYDRLGELRVAAARTGETNLVAADRAGHRWQMPLRGEDVPRLQAVLDIVDSRVGTETAPVSVLQPQLIRAATFVVFVVSVNAGLLATAIVLAMTLAQPAAPLLAGAGLAAVAGSFLTWRDPGGAFGFMPDGYNAGFTLILLGAGVLLLWLAYARRRDEITPRVWRLVGVVAAAAAASWLLPVLGGGLDAVALHQAARGWPATVLLPLAFAGAVLWSPRRILRVAAAVAVAASVAAASVGSHAFLDRFGGDPFLIPAPDLHVRTLDHAVREFTLPFGVSELELSPNGRSIAVVSPRPDYHPMLHVGRAGEPLTAIDGSGALFVDDDHVIVWSTDGSRTDLRQVSVTTPGVADWQLQVTGLSAPALSIDPASKRWRLASPGFRFLETREGVIGTPQIESYQWPVRDGHTSPIIPVALAGNRALALEPRPDLASPITDPFGGLMLVLASSVRWRSTIWALGPDGAADLGTSRLELTCQRLPATGGVCEIYDASRTRFLAMDAGTRGVRGVASLPGRFLVGTEPKGAWITGWHQSDIVAVRLDPVDAIRIAGPNGARPHIVAASDRAAAGVWYQMPPASAMRVDAIYPQAATSIVRVYAIE